ncbi:MAG: NADH-quinone oxidoreductase subunit L [Alphaproteobacteria bacterium CG11_big_fil_rev_8_21_14_0_20_44_7]|nr:MAG: NADH-quinone oxidoreductase subunit L [Alphaproteobacteria bacterium CG11_big_fil_rev_8_21_14_0_20_44_7]
MISAKLILFLPLIAAVFIGIQSRTVNYKFAQLVTTSCVFLSAILSGFMFHKVAIRHEEFTYPLIDWIYSGDFKADWAIKIDTLTAIMLVVVTWVSALVHLFSIGYMAEDPHKPRFMAYLSLFTFFMLVLVTADNFIQMFVGWEGVGLCSYLLIGFWFKKESANAAAMKAFVVNRVGDFGFILGIAAVYVLFGSVEFAEIFKNPASAVDVYWDILGYQVHAITLTTILLFIGAMGKSAQFGLHTWLPDAMEGPTPVSALIHAATMVTAGVFMLARVSPLIQYAPEALAFIAVIGGITAIFAATIALTQNDIKKVIAYSTCSQLGYMVFICGLGAYSAGIFHLATHAFFKALLFLGAGSVIHAMHHEQDMRKMGGLWRKIKFTYVMMAIGSLAIIGAPLFAGYYSKEAILGIAYHTDSNVAQFAFWMGALTALLTAFYSARLFFLTFHGKPRDQHAYDHAHESPWVMRIPLLLLAIGAVFSGYYGEEILHILSPVGEFWNGALVTAGAHHNPLEHIHPPHWIVPASISAALIGAIIYGWKLGVARKLAEILAPLYKLSFNKWYIDEIYDAVFVRPYKKSANILWRIIDAKIIDNMPNGAALASKYIAAGLSRLQSGYIYQYAFVIVASILMILTYYLWF